MADSAAEAFDAVQFQGAAQKEAEAPIETATPQVGGYDAVGPRVHVQFCTS